MEKQAEEVLVKHLEEQAEAMLVKHLEKQAEEVMVKHYGRSRICPSHLSTTATLEYAPCTLPPAPHAVDFQAQPPSFHSTFPSQPHLARPPTRSPWTGNLPLNP